MSKPLEKIAPGINWGILGNWLTDEQKRDIATKLTEHFRRLQENVTIDDAVKRLQDEKDESE